MIRARLYCSPTDYHADKIGEERPSLNQSIATKLIQQSPLHAWNAHPKLGGDHDSPTPEMDFGSMVHSIVLGKGATIESYPFQDWRTKDARVARDECRKRGRIPVLEHKLSEAQAVAGEIASQVGSLLKGESEVMFAWEESGVLCRAALDHLVAPNTTVLGLIPAVILDLKLVSSANPRALSRKAIDGGWAIQRAAYISAVKAVHPKWVESDEINFQIIAAEVEPPYAITVCRLGNVLEQLGEEQWKRAVRTWGECLKSDTWPGYGREVTTLEAPAFAIAELEAEVERG